MLASVRPRDIAGNTRRGIAVEEVADLVAVEAKFSMATAALKAIVRARGSHLMDLQGVGPGVAAQVLADVGDVARFADRNRFASWTGTAPLDDSSGEQTLRQWQRAVLNPRELARLHVDREDGFRWVGTRPLTLPPRCASRLGAPSHGYERSSRDDRL